jgi:hypothetical protein
MSTSKTADAPERIYLQTGADPEDGWPTDDDEVTWCRDAVHDSDVPYVREDLHLAEVERLTELVDDLTIQSTYGEHDANTFDSGAITAYAEGLRDMARRGRVRITHERYRRVIAEFTEEELARQRAVVDAARATLEVKDE